MPCPVCSGHSDGQSGALPCLFRLFRPFRRTERCLALSVQAVQALQTDTFFVFIGCESNGVATATPIPRVFPSLSHLYERCDDLMIRGLSAELTIGDVLLQPGLLSQCLQKSLIIRHWMPVESSRIPHSQFLRHSLQTSFVGL